MVQRPDDVALTAAAAEVADVTRRRYPDLAVPYHSRWRHFEAGGIDGRPTLAQLEPDRRRARDGRPGRGQRAARRRRRRRLALRRSRNGLRFGRSEGLGVASWHAFAPGLLLDAGDPLRADAAGLQRLDAERLAARSR